MLFHWCFKLRNLWLNQQHIDRQYNSTKNGMTFKHINPDCEYSQEQSREVCCTRFYWVLIAPLLLQQQTRTAKPCNRALTTRPQSIIPLAAALIIPTYTHVRPHLSYIHRCHILSVPNNLSFTSNHHVTTSNHPERRYPPVSN